MNLKPKIPQPSPGRKVDRPQVSTWFKAIGVTLLVLYFATAIYGHYLISKRCDESGGIPITTMVGTKCLKHRVSK